MNFIRTNSCGFLFRRDVDLPLHFVLIFLHTPVPLSPPSDKCLLIFIHPPLLFHLSPCHQRNTSTANIDVIYDGERRQLKCRILLVLVLFLAYTYSSSYNISAHSWNSCVSIRCPMAGYYWTIRIGIISNTSFVSNEPGGQNCLRISSRRSVTLSGSRPGTEWTYSLFASMLPMPSALIVPWWASICLSNRV